MRSMRIATMLGAAAALGIATSATAAFELQIDIDGVTMDAGGAFDVNTYTGTMNFSMNSGTSLAGIFIDSTGQTVTATLASLSGSVNYVNAQATGGSFTVMLSDGSSYSASVDTGPSFLFPDANGFSGDGGTEFGNFSNLVGGNLFGGVDVTPWNYNNSIGFFFFSEYNPDGAGVDTAANLNLFVNVPSPGLAAFGLAGIGAGLRRRRR